MYRNSFRSWRGYVALLTIVFASAQMSWAEDGRLDLSLRPAIKANSVDANFGLKQPGGTGGGVSARQHPQWVKDFEAKMWPGFLTGLDGYEDFVMPVGNFIYFEDPFITTDVRLIYVHHTIPNRSVLRGGQVQAVAAQIRIALTEKLALIATKDGYSWVDSHITAAGDGWNDLAIGLKYVLHSDPQEQFLVSGGMRWEWNNGSTDAWQGGDSQELSPFIAVAKGWGKWHFLGNVTGRIPTNHHDANYSLLWSLHLDYKMTETFRPLVELHGTHWLSNADRLPFSEDYLDIGSLGAADARGRDLFVLGLGFRWQARDNVNVGMIYQFPLESAAEHLYEQRITFNTVVSF
ncbi:MAG: hypothetical protein IID35_04125 [Planctomycetes bacterium]|nr:hypothetical protein [Planctomycetota bacterium]